MFPAGRCSGDFGNPPHVRTPAHSRAQIESSPARSLYTARGGVSPATGVRPDALQSKPTHSLVAYGSHTMCVHQLLLLPVPSSRTMATAPRAGQSHDHWFPTTMTFLRAPILPYRRVLHSLNVQNADLLWTKWITPSGNVVRLSLPSLPPPGSSRPPVPHPRNNSWLDTESRSQVPSTIASTGCEASQDISMHYRPKV